MFFPPYEICCFLIRFPISSNRMRKPQTPQKLESSPTSSQGYTGTIQRTSWRKSAPVSVSFVYCIWRTNRVSNSKPEPRSTTLQTRNEWGIFGISRYAHLNRVLGYPLIALCLGLSRSNGYACRIVLLVPHLSCLYTGFFFRVL